MGPTVPCEREYIGPRHLLPMWEGNHSPLGISVPTTENQKDNSSICFASMNLHHITYSVLNFQAETAFEKITRPVKLSCLSPRRNGEEKPVGQNPGGLLAFRKRETRFNFKSQIS